MVGVEIGGTFTDLILMSDTEIIATLKVPQRPNSLKTEFLKPLASLVELFLIWMC